MQSPNKTISLGSIAACQPCDDGDKNRGEKLYVRDENGTTNMTIAGILQNDDMMKGGPRFRLRYPSAAQPMRTSVYLCPEQAVEMTN